MREGVAHDVGMMSRSRSRSRSRRAGLEVGNVDAGGVDAYAAPKGGGDDAGGGVAEGSEGGARSRGGVVGGGVAVGGVAGRGSRAEEREGTAASASATGWRDDLASGASGATLHPSSSSSSSSSSIRVDGAAAAAEAAAAAPASIPARYARRAPYAASARPALRGRGETWRGAGGRQRGCPRGDVGAAITGGWMPERRLVRTSTRGREGTREGTHPTPATTTSARRLLRAAIIESARTLTRDSTL